MAMVKLTVGCRIVFEAIDASTALPVAGVTIQNPTVYGDDVTPAAPGPVVPPPTTLFVPASPMV